MNRYTQKGIPVVTAETEVRGRRLADHGEIRSMRIVTDSTFLLIKWPVNRVSRKFLLDSFMASEAEAVFRYDQNKVIVRCMGVMTCRASRL